MRAAGRSSLPPRPGLRLHQVRKHCLQSVFWHEMGDGGSKSGEGVAGIFNGTCFFFFVLRPCFGTTSCKSLIIGLRRALIFVGRVCLVVGGDVVSCFELNSSSSHART